MNTEISLDTKLWVHKNFSGLSLEIRGVLGE